MRCGTPITGSDTITLGDMTYVLAGFGRRFAGHLIDVCLVSAPLVFAFVTSLVAISRAPECDSNPAQCIEDDRWLSGPLSIVLLWGYRSATGCYGMPWGPALAGGW